MTPRRRDQRSKLADPAPKGHLKLAQRAGRVPPAGEGPLWNVKLGGGGGEREARRLANGQRGLLIHAQLLTAGISRSRIGRWLASGRLAADHRGVYRLGHDAPPPFQRELAAVLCCPGYAVLSHLSAAEVWGVCPPGGQNPVQVTTVGRRMRPPPGVTVRRIARLDPADFRVHDGLPVTSPARTLVDLAATGGETLERALSEMRFRRLVRDDEILAAIERKPRARGVGRLRALLRAEAESGYTRSAAERRLRALLRRAHLPVPRFNWLIGGYEVDALWPALRLVIEVDGFAGHGHRSAFERDRRKDQRLTAAGYTVIRITWRQLVDEPLATAVLIGQAVARLAA